MESDLNQCTLDQWVSSYPQSIPVDYSSTIFPLPFALSDLSLPPNSQISSNYPKRSDLGIEMEGGLWNNIGDHMQLVPSPSSDYCRDIDARFTHDSSTPISTLPHDPYLVVQEQFRSAPWRRAGELEPKDPNTGRSVLYALLEERTGGNKGPIHKCRLCTRVFNRVDRAITHIRHKHLDHRPFRCGGDCGTKGCLQRFHSQENVTSHVRPKRVVCSHCKHEGLRQNLKRHIDKYHRK